MTSLATCATTAQAVVKKRVLSDNAAFYLMASITVSFLAGSSAPTPLYALYQSQWGFASIMITVIFGIYAFAVLAALLIIGRLSDHLGRRPVLLVATAVQAATMLMFFTANSVTDLLSARIIQGLATGAALGAVGAGMIDLDRERGATANAIAPTLGTATGGLLSGLLVQYLPAPTHLVYAVLGVVFLLQGIGIALMADTLRPTPGALASLKPQFGVPPAVRGPMLLALPVLIAAWSLAGFYGSLGPMLVRAMLGVGSPLLGGMALFTLAASAGLAVLVTQRREPFELMIIGALLLAIGAGVGVLAITRHAIMLFLLGTGIAGVGFGAGFQGAVRSVVRLAEPHQRAGVLSVIFIVSYLSMGLPAIAAGAWLSRHGEPLATSKGFGIAVVTLCLAAVLLAVLRSRSLPAAHSRPT
jgi:MFS family permease